MKANITYKHQAPLGYLVHEVARLMKRRFEDHAKAYGVTLPQWRVLAQIGMIEGITQVQLAQSMDADQMTISGVLDRLEKRGLVERYVDPSDSRAKLARLTGAGTDVFNTARTVGFAMYEAALEGVTPQEREAAMSCLTKMRNNLAGTPAELEEV